MNALAKGRANSLSERAAINHMAAIASPQFELGIFNAAANEGDGQMLLRQWTSAEVMTAFDWLRWKNAQRCEIYIRPVAPHDYSLLDDLSKESVSRLFSEGFDPSVIVETSPGNFQAWLYHGQTLTPAISTEAARILAEKFGADPGSADFRHFGRLAGFTNNKAKHRLSNGLQPFVLLHEHCRAIYHRASEVIDEARKRVEDAERELASAREFTRNKPMQVPRKTIDDFYSDVRYAGDLNRADLAYCVYALSHGCCEDDVAQALRQRDLSKKGSIGRQEAYVQRTLRKAIAAAGHSSA